MERLGNSKIFERIETGNPIGEILKTQANSPVKYSGRYRILDSQISSPRSFPRAERNLPRTKEKGFFVRPQLEFILKKLPRGQRNVVIEVAQWQQRGKECFFSYRTISGLIGFSRRHAIKCAKKLEAKGVLLITRRPGKRNTFKISEAILREASKLIKNLPGKVKDRIKRLQEIQAEIRLKSFVEFPCVAKAFIGVNCHSPTT